MDRKAKCAQFWGKVRIFWAAFLKACGAAWNRTKVFLKKVMVWLGKAWGKTRVWLRKVWNITNIWMTKAWNVTRTGLNKAGVFLGKVWAFLSDHGKRLLGMLAVLVLKVRKWFVDRMAQLKARRLQSSGSAKPKEKKKLPKPVEKPVPVKAAAEAPVARKEEPKLQIADDATIRLDPIRKTQPRKVGRVAAVFMGIWKVISTTFVWIYRLRKYIMAIPVAFCAIKLAMLNADRLPDVVGINMQATGEFGRMISRSNAVWWPLGLTAFCLTLVLCSKKPLLPWLISAFTLILPILIWMTNYYG